MHRVLFIAYHFPPCDEIGGSLRSEKFVKYLPRIGWQPHVLSLSQKDPTVEEKYPFVERLPSFTPWNRPYRMTPYGWIPSLYIYGRRLLRRISYDLIYVSCPPFPHAIVAPWLKRFARIPLVIDFRDAWSVGPYMEGNSLNRLIYRHLFPTMEKKVLTEVDGLILNTPSSLEAYLKKYPDLAGRVTMIPNGYDEDDFVDYRPIKSTQRMTLLYSGNFGIAGRHPGPLLEAIRQLVGESRLVQLDIIGHHGPELTNLVGDLGLKDHVRFFGQIPHEEALYAMAGSDILVLYQERSQARVTPIAGKTYEYLRAGKAILAIAPSGDNLDIVRENAARYETVSSHDPSDIAQAIRKLHSDWERGSLIFNMPPSKVYIEQYNRQALTDRLASYFENLVTRF